MEMTLKDALALLTPYDLAAVGFLLLTASVLGWRIEHPGARRPSVAVLMETYRREWMRQFIRREQKIFDATILAGLREGAAFFASTTLIAVGGALALIGNPEPLEEAAGGLSGADAPHLLWRMKLALVVLFLAHAFLRFVWSTRVFAYSAVAMASVPLDPEDPRALPRADMAAALNIRAAHNFNRGLRSLYFALAALGWLIGPWGLAAATVAVGWLVWSREFLSAPHAALKDCE